MRAPTSEAAAAPPEPMADAAIDDGSTGGGGGRLRSLLTGTPGAFAALAGLVVAFTGGWVRGALVIDGPGIAVYVRLALRYLRADGRIPYWLPDMWAGSPVWAIGPSLSAVMLVPLAAVFGPEGAVRAGIVVLQVVGAWGAFVLARALWRSTPAALVAGVVYGVGPLVISHAALSGSESTMGVIAAAPWLTWTLRQGLRGHGTRYVVASGCIAAFAVLHQAEYAYGLALLGLFQVVGELTRIRSGEAARQRTAEDLRLVLVRTALAGAICLGLIAHWIFPFLSLADSFVLSPPELVVGEMLRGVGHAVGMEMGYFFRRSEPLTGVVSVFRENLLGYALYLGVVPVAVTSLSALAVARRDGDRTFSGTLVASVGALWLSTGAVALAASGPVRRGQVAPMLVVAVLAGVVAAGYVRRLRLGWATWPVLAGVLGLLVAVPYLTPFLTLQRVVPLLDSIRFSRFYVISILALALGTAWPVAHVRHWLPAHRATLRRWAPAGLAAALAVAVVVDAWPYRSFYFVRQPDSAQAYRDVADELASMAPGTRVAVPSQDGRTIDILLRQGKELSMGWPHPVASGQVWRVTIGAAVAPPGYGRLAFELSSTAYTLIEKLNNRSTAIESVSEIDLRPVDALPRVRAYDRTLVVGDREVSTELATALARRHIGIVTSPDVPPAVAATARGVLPPGRSCAPDAVGRLEPGLAGEVGLACGMSVFLPRMAAGNIYLGPGESPGATFTAVADDLRGVTVWYEGRIGNGVMVLREKVEGGPDREVARAVINAVNEYDLAVFGFDPIPDSAGRRYTFTVECPGCFDEIEPAALAAVNVLGTGNLEVNGRLDPDHTLNFSPTYTRLDPQPPSMTEVSVLDSGPGRWRLATSGPNPSVVVVADAYFPGWKARVDGRPARVLEADGAFIGVAVGPGEHTVTFDYGPGPAAIAGRLVTLATLLALVVVPLVSRRRRLRHALQVGAPAADGGREPALDAGEHRPRPPVSGREGPGGKGDQAVLAAVDDAEPGVGEHGHQ